MPPVEREHDPLYELQQGLAQRLGQRRYQQWFGAGTRFAVDGDELQLQVASPYLLTWIERNYLSVVRELTQSLLGPSMRVTCRVVGAGEVTLQPALAPIAAAPLPAVASVARQTQPESKSSTRQGKGRRLARLSDFVSGPCNDLACAAAMQVVGQQESSPFVYFQAGVGNGKTHLLEGILRELRHSGGVQALLMGADQFTTYFSQAMAARSTPSFRARFQGLDVLLLDDVDFLDGKRGTQEELLQIIKRLEANHGQVIVSGNCHPRLLTKTSDELISRFQSGLVCRLESPSTEVRREIIQRHALRQRVTLSAGAQEFIVNRFTRNVRELEGAVNILATWSRMTNKRVGSTAAREVLGRLERDCLKIIKLTDIEQAVCSLFSLSPEDLRGASRKQQYTQPRMLAMYLARRLAQAPYGEIGEHFGRRNHSTVMSAERKIADQMQSGVLVRLGAESWSMGDLLRTLEDRIKAS